MQPEAARLRAETSGDGSRVGISTPIGIGSAIGIEVLIKVGAKASGDLAARATLRAEHCEALIGAIYRISGKVLPVQTWLTPYWQETSRDVLADPHRGNSKSALQEWTQAQGLGLPSYTCQGLSQQQGDPRRFP